MSDMSDDIYEEFFEMLSQMDPNSESKTAPLEDLLVKMMAEMDIKDPRTSLAQRLYQEQIEKYRLFSAAKWKCEQRMDDDDDDDDQDLFNEDECDAEVASIMDRDGGDDLEEDPVIRPVNQELMNEMERMQEFQFLRDGAENEEPGNKEAGQEARQEAYRMKEMEGRSRFRGSNSLI